MLPTHGFGSFCAAGPTGGASESTIDQERRENPAFTLDQKAWVARTLGALDAYPAYYVHMGQANSAGPREVDLGRPEPAAKEVLADRIREGEWVVDLRNRTAFAAAHVPGTLNFGLDGQFVTYLGWLIPWGTPLTLLGEDAEQVEEAQRELVRIGIDRLEGAATGDPQDWTDRDLATFPVASFAELAQVRHHRPVEVLDVRRDLEFGQGHIEGAISIPLHELVSRLDELPEGEIWVHCAGGYRASIAASFLAATGRTVVAVDDSFGNAEPASLVLSGAA